jgi:RNA polymerase sigma-70 factor (ECF subfamily)
MDFETLYRSYARDVYRFALFLSGRPDEADDITAETFVRALTSREPIRVGTVKAYLFMIARNLYRAGLRRQARHVDLHRDHDDVPDRSRDPEAAAATRHELVRVLQSMQALPELDRATLLMRTHDEMPYEEIAAALGISVAAAKVKVCRARMKLNEIRDAKETP